MRYSNYILIAIFVGTYLSNFFLPFYHIKDQKVFMFLAGICVLILIGLCFLLHYKGDLSKKANDKQTIAKLKLVSKLILYTFITLTVLLTVTFMYQLVLVMNAGDFSVSVIFKYHFLWLLGALMFVLSALFEKWKDLRFYIASEPNIIIAVYYDRQHSMFLGKGELQKARDALVEACKYVPTAIPLKCKLALLYEHDNIDKAKQLLKETKSLLENSEDATNEDYAWYESILGHILLKRGHCAKGLKHIKRSVELDPNPRRVKSYEEMKAKFNETT